MKKFKYIIVFFLYASLISQVIAAEKFNVSEKTLNDYRTYSLARCISNNYKSMGIDFNKSHIKDFTMGFIDIEEGFAFSAEKDNALDSYISNKTKKFYLPKQAEGDLSNVNLVIFDCVEFSQSKELNTVLRDLIEKANSDSE